VCKIFITKDLRVDLGARRVAPFWLLPLLVGIGLWAAMCRAFGPETIAVTV
jgi:hypothetical protein